MEDLEFPVNLNLSYEELWELWNSDIPLKLSKNFSLDEYLSVANEYTADDRWFSRGQEIAIIFSFTFISILGLIGNGLVIYIIAKKGWRQSSRNWFILNLAVSDILTCVVCKPLTVVRVVLKNWVLGEILCKMVPSLQTVYVLVSALTIVALAFDRYSSIIYNNQGAKFKGWVSVCIGLIWTCSIGLSMPTAIVHEIKQIQGYNNTIIYSLCFESWQTETAVHSYITSLLLIQYLSPLFSIVVLHLLIGRFLRSRFTHSCEDVPNARRKKARHRKNMLLLSSMAISFGVAWFPLNLINTWATINYSSFKGINFSLLHAMCLILAFSSVCVNPVIYGLLNTNFRRDLVKICRGHQPHYSVYTDYQRRSSNNGEQLGLISASPNDTTMSFSNLTKIRTCTITSL